MTYSISAANSSSEPTLSTALEVAVLPPASLSLSSGCSSRASPTIVSLPSSTTTVGGVASFSSFSGSTVLDSGSVAVAVLGDLLRVVGAAFRFGRDLVGFVDVEEDDEADVVAAVDGSVIDVEGIEGEFEVKSGSDSPRDKDAEVDNVVDNVVEVDDVVDVVEVVVEVDVVVEIDADEQSGIDVEFSVSKKADSGTFSF